MNRLGSPWPVFTTQATKPLPLDHKAPPSKASPVRPSLAGVLKTVMFLAALAGRAQATTPDSVGIERDDGKPPLPTLNLVDVVSRACADGVCSALVGLSVGEDNLFPAECPIIANTIEGAGLKASIPGGREVLFQSPGNPLSGSLEGPGVHAGFWREVCRPVETARRLEEVLGTQPGLRSITANFMNRMAPRLAPEQPGSALVTIADIMFALGRQNTERTVVGPWHPTTTMTFTAPVPLGKMSDDLLDTMQRRAPSIFVCDNMIFTPARMGGSVDRQAVLDHYVGQGYIGLLVGLKDSMTDWQAVALVPPTPGMLETFGKYAETPMSGVTVYLPTADARAEFSRRYQRQTDWAGIAMLAVSVGAGVAVLMSADSRRDPTQVAPGGKAHRPLTPEAPRSGRRVRHGVSPHTADQPASFPLPGSSRAGAQRPSEPAAAYRSAVNEMRGLSYAQREGLVSEWASHVQQDTQGGAALTSAYLRALGDSKMSEGARARLLETLGADSAQVLGALGTFVGSHPDDRPAARELAALRLHLQPPDVPQTSADPAADTKGAQPARGTAREPTPCNFRAFHDHARELAAQTSQDRKNLQHEQGDVLATRVGGDIFIPHERAPLHFHVGPQFATLKTPGGKPIFVFKHGENEARKPGIQAALDLARQNRDKMSDSALDALTKLTGIDIREEDTD